jgi:leucyl-tRNA synthetase
VQGVSRFLKRVWVNFDKIDNDCKDTKELLIKLNQSIVSITNDLESFQMNTVISRLMEINNAIDRTGKISTASYKTFLKLLFPVAPHISEELWQMIGEKKSIENNKWPVAIEQYLKADQIEIVVQINGKVRDKVMVSSDIEDVKLKEIALNLEKVRQYIDNHEVVKVIVVSKKLVSIVTK